jgi:hypothetical protein
MCYRNRNYGWTHVRYFQDPVGWVRSAESESTCTADKIPVVLTSSWNPGGTCIADGGASSEFDRDREVVVVFSLMSCLELISSCAIGQHEQQCVQFLDFGPGWTESQHLTKYLQLLLEHPLRYQCSLYHLNR